MRIVNAAEEIEDAFAGAKREALADAGATSIEAGSFVSPKWVPQMADTAEVLARLSPWPGVGYTVLVPNLQSLDRALASGVFDILCGPWPALFASQRHRRLRSPGHRKVRPAATRYRSRA